MRHHGAFLLLAFCLTAPAADGANTPSRFRRAFNGVPVAPGEMPYVVYLDLGCTSSLISKRHILTAAHCVQGYNDNSGVLHFRITRHPNAEVELNAENDIAILTLWRPVELSNTTQPIKLADTEFFEEHSNGSALAAGWGSHKVEGDHIVRDSSSDVLLKVELDLYSPSHCIEAEIRLGGNATDLDFDPSSNICAGSPDQGVAHGDSGGPVVVFDEEGLPRQIGIASYVHGRWDGLVSNQKKYPAVYERVDRYLDWILKTIAEDDAEEQPEDLLNIDWQ